MSAALVESVRSNLCMAPDVREEYGLDLPAILAALTEGEALRVQIAAGQAREVALREEAKRFAYDYLCHHGYGYGEQCTVALCDGNALRDALSAPTDTAALRAFGERCVLGALGDERIDYRGDDEDCPANVAAQSVDRILGGS